MHARRCTWRRGATGMLLPVVVAVMSSASCGPTEAGRDADTYRVAVATFSHET